MDNWEERCKAAEAELAQLQPLWGMLQREQVAFSQAEAERDAAQAEAERLRLERDGWMKASDELSAEIERLLAQVVTLEALWQRAIDADLLDDPHELGNAIADASALLNYPPPGCRLRRQDNW